jgi:hypothetical protein
MFLPVLVYSVAIAAYGYSQTTTAITPVCLPPAAYSMVARQIWIISNVVIVLLVLLAYGTAQYKIRTANNGSYKYCFIVIFIKDAILIIPRRTGGHS